MNSLSPTRLPWDQRQRLMLLEARVIWDGLIRAGDLRDAFDISTRKAEKDIALYRARCPDNLDLDVATGVYRASDRFEPAFLRGSAEEWLSVLRHHDLAQDLPLAMAAAGHVPAEILELPQREFDVRVLQRLGTAIREQRWLSIEYQSMNRPDPRALQIAPHSLAYVGRWHARAYSLEHQGFRDFLLSRIIGLPGLGDSAGIDSAQDWDWRNHVTVRVGPHPGLTEPQRRVVEHDFGMHHGTLEKHLRLALVPYWLKLMNVGRGDIERHAAEQQIVLLNQAELDAFNRLG
ncbi:Predicted DNA-binding transcriptional regulator YafY, contains an HTH and WYL domains [Hydrocarboniphaga daqingensis]|uniref:Predicted DNA-binding transcriptional regulator YafY, contains an HTH and WYL domains n=1 Tax=Hydrocarboniphaga daqingensis TaxID=490188 RepID=A0A1M5LSJ7_9GAMM|nr:WYL domain-containing protein [Hydrocarboniphaga daqingensis]SHG67991.1 Predicted DNA-binding transcriptional regulator YafY, contains an HTH and WYL domains [Hydrocarboniphaga daqingensis]